ncbi:MAG: acyl carrier protein [Cyanobacteriota bacterium]|nr:acyl carrier protein [Cyanobacteriota bacterium]
MQELDPKDYILGCIRKALGQEIDTPALPALPLDAAGIDSLELMELLNDIEDLYHIRFDDQAFGDGKTVQDLISYVSSRVGSRP